MMSKRIGAMACALAVALLGMALVTGRMAHSASRQNDIAVTGAWVRLPVVPGRPAAGFLTITGGAAPDRLLGASSPKASRIELHESRMDGGVMRMILLPSVATPARAEIAFAPQGRHLMLFGLPASLKPGDTLPLSLRFERAGVVRMTANVRSGQNESHAHHH